jgi:S-adenosyl-L-methionine hydrolase (adenosine-forming)
MSLPIITLTTDLGTKDYYVPSARGYLWSRLPGANITDITHQIKPFRLDDASFVLKGCFEDFPPGTIHIISVDTGHNSGNRFIAAKAKGHYFICADNGIVSLLVEEDEIEKVVELPFIDTDLIFPLKFIFVPAAVHIAEQGSIEGLGNALPSFVRKANMRPLIEESIIRGAVIYVDNLGNAITNIDKQNFDRFSKGRKYRINFSRSDYFEKISIHYNEVPEGEKVCVFGTNGLLELAINKGSCTNLLGIKTGHAILIEFL